ncbi:NACHT nucleoside triphosphatase [Fusarium albosuccineum]|uniref:NACHT nucleoside triphosphatase n=1 Tax=Fusarium albosuccineum TaxID=1237068 RepID=A0A8H4PKB9_9HYPO|nr:NACHT nucleoside triphosphatase [Fusarium albosuccineum]
MSSNSPDPPSTVASPPSNQTNDNPIEALNTSRDEARNQTDRIGLDTDHPEQGLNTAPSTTVRTGDDAADLWSTAYREAVESLGEDIDVAILQGKNVEQLFRELEEVDNESTQGSAFLRGLKYLQSIQVPLERFKLALDLASPLASFDPAASTVFGLVRGVTAIAVSVSTADLEFAKQIAEMLEQISYIDDCDTLGQKVEKKDIHRALVSVYKKLLEFYNAAFEILSKRGTRLVMGLILENGRLPSIVKDFLKQADTLRKLVQKATLEIVEDIKAMLYDQEIGRWLDSSNVKRQSQYHTSLRDLRADEGCEFLLEDSNFINWYRASNSEQLMLLGEMGHGKTVAMAFLVDELSRRSEKQLPQSKVCYYYCRDDGTGQVVQIFSCLVLSLLEQLPGLKKKFYEWYKQAQASGSLDPATDTKKLEEFLQRLLEAIDRPLFWIIDGLDECGRASRNILLKSLETFTQKFPRFRFILSSRPQEEILDQVDGMAKIYLPCNTKRDGVIVQKSVEGRLSYLSKDVKTLIIERLSRLAQGSAIWTKMVVDLIEVRSIRALGPMRIFLEELPLPEQLSELYTTLFLRCTLNDAGNKELAGTALRILAIARRPLSVLELAWAATLWTTKREVTTVAALDDLIDHQRVMSLIYPFIARLNIGDVKKRQVQLVHQSMKEFIIEEWTEESTDWPCRQTPAPSTTTDKAPLHQRIENLERLILNICIKYLKLDEIGTTEIFSEEQVAIEALPQDIDLFDDDTPPTEYDPYCSWGDWEEDMIRYDPTENGFGEFFVYASCYWIHHFGAVTTEPLPALSSIEDLCQAGSTRLDNWIQQNRRPDCAILPRFEFDGSLYDPLSITSLYGSESMLREMLENSDLGNSKFLPSTMLEAARQILQWGDLSRLKILLEGTHGHQLQNLGFFRLVIERWSVPATQYRAWDPVFDLIDYVLDILVQEQWGNELLNIAAGAGCRPIVQRLMVRAQHSAELKDELMRGNTRNEPQRDALRIAVRLGDLDMCRLLVCTGKMDPLSALTHDDNGQIVLKDETRENKKHSQEILHLLCDNVA